MLASASDQDSSEPSESSSDESSATLNALRGRTRGAASESESASRDNASTIELGEVSRRPLERERMRNGDVERPLERDRSESSLPNDGLRELDELSLLRARERPRSPSSDLSRTSPSVNMEVREYLENVPELLLVGRWGGVGVRSDMEDALDLRGGRVELSPSLWWVLSCCKVSVKPSSDVELAARRGGGGLGSEYCHESPSAGVATADWTDCRECERLKRPVDRRDELLLGVR